MSVFNKKTVVRTQRLNNKKLAVTSGCNLNKVSSVQTGQ